MVGIATITRMAFGQIDYNTIARQSYDYWRSVGYDHDSACAWVGNAQGETDLDVHAVGDHGEAFGFGQDHKDRAENIKKHTGIDVMDYNNLTVDDALKAVDWESSNAIGVRHVREHVMAAKGIRAKVSVIVNEYEFSKHRDSDIDKRTAYAEDWSAVALAGQWNARWDGVHT